MQRQGKYESSKQIHLCWGKLWRLKLRGDSAKKGSRKGKGRIKSWSKQKMSCRSWSSNLGKNRSCTEVRRKCSRNRNNMRRNMHILMKLCPYRLLNHPSSWHIADRVTSCRSRTFLKRLNRYWNKWTRIWFSWSRIRIQTSCPSNKRSLHRLHHLQQQSKSQVNKGIPFFLGTIQEQRCTT